MPKAKLRVLVLSDFLGNDANVVRDYLYCFNQHSRHEFFYLHLWSKNGCRRLQGFDFNRFDVIVLFWDFFWIGSDDPLGYCYVPAWISDRIAGSRALKVQFLQDEYREVRLANRVMQRFGVNVMFSCVAEKDQELFYPKDLIPSLTATYPVLTGYVPAYLEKINFPASIDRSIDIGYRSRKLPYYLGKLGQEKTFVAEQFQRIADEFGFLANISVKENDRIYGDRWLEFQKSCRFSLGTESGASVVDFDGKIRKKCQAYLRDHPQATFTEVSNAAFAEVDGKVVVQTISPRIFEASAFENTLILHEGYYEGMLQPDVHYIAVKKDYSNVQDVVERMRDRSYCEKLARNAKDTLINSKQFNYQSFVQRFDEILEHHVKPGRNKAAISRTLFYLMNYVNNDRLLPHGGVFLRIPHTCDAVYQFNKIVPYVMVLWHSLKLVISFACQSPRLLAIFVDRLANGEQRNNVSMFGLLRDFRILALLNQARFSGSAFELHLIYQKDIGQLVVRSNPCSAPANVNPTLVPNEDEFIAQLLANGKAFLMTWDHRLVGSTLALPAGNRVKYGIDLPEDCTYRFEAFNRLPEGSSGEKAAVLKEVLFGKSTEPALSKKLYVLVAVLCAIAAGIVNKPLRHLRTMVRVFGRAFVNTAPTSDRETTLRA